MAVQLKKQNMLATVFIILMNSSEKLAKKQKIRQFKYSNVWSLG